ncbi:hypothetical protein KEM52_002045 [Ascosphaera acerosa]|nr:hypothetical protein KEM52_002045 [Ascosphaera acerosa]
MVEVAATSAVHAGAGQARDAAGRDRDRAHQPQPQQQHNDTTTAPDRRHRLVAAMQAGLTQLFDALYAAAPADDGVALLAPCVLDDALWAPPHASPAAQQHCESELFLLLVAKLLESGYDDPDDHARGGFAIGALARLMAARADRLAPRLDAEGVDAVVAGLDVRLAPTTRAQATLVLAQYLAVMGGSNTTGNASGGGQAVLARCIAARAERGRHGADGETIVACSALAALYPLVPGVCTPIFLGAGGAGGAGGGGKDKNAGLKSRLSELTDPRRRPSDAMTRAILALLNAALVDAAARQAVAAEFADWLAHLVGNARSAENAALAALALAKLRAAGGGPRGSTESVIEEEEGSMHGLVERFVAQLNISSAAEAEAEAEVGPVGQPGSRRPDSDRAEEALRMAVEGLAYSSIQPEVKEQLVDEPTFLPTLVQVMRRSAGGAHTTTFTSAASPSPSSTVYGGLAVLANLTRYRPSRSEEQKKLAELKAYADAARPAASTATDDLDSDSRVDRRCAAAVAAGVVPLLRELWTSAGKPAAAAAAAASSRVSAAETSPASQPPLTLTAAAQEMMAQILLALTRDQRGRGALAQQGAVRLLLAMLDESVENPARAPLPPPARAAVRAAAAQALARVLIALSPVAVFPPHGSPHVASAIGPLTSLLRVSGPRFGPSDDAPRDLLPAFEALMALTNLAAHPDPAAATAIVKLAWSGGAGCVQGFRGMRTRARLVLALER